MTRASRGISPIQEKARGKDMIKDPRKKAAPAKSEKLSVDVAKRGAGRVAVPAGAPGVMGGMGALGMKKGGSCKGYAKGGSIDGVAKKGKTRGKIC